MPDAKSIIGGIVVIIFTVLVARNPRPALWSMLVILAAVYVLLVWREWFGEEHWAVGSTALAGAIGVVVFGSLWWFVILPKPQAETCDSMSVWKCTSTPLSESDPSR